MFQKILVQFFIGILTFFKSIFDTFSSLFFLSGWSKNRKFLRHIENVKLDLGGFLTFQSTLTRDICILHLV